MLQVNGPSVVCVATMAFVHQKNIR